MERVQLACTYEVMSYLDKSCSKQDRRVSSYVIVEDMLFTFVVTILLVSFPVPCLPSQLVPHLEIFGEYALPFSIYLLS